MWRRGARGRLSSASRYCDMLRCAQEVLDEPVGATKRFLPDVGAQRAPQLAATGAIGGESHGGTDEILMRESAEVAEAGIRQV